MMGVLCLKEILGMFLELQYQFISKTDLTSNWVRNMIAQRMCKNSWLSWRFAWLGRCGGNTNKDFSKNKI